VKSISLNRLPLIHKVDYLLGAVHKTSAQNREKLALLSSCPKCLHWINPLSMRKHHRFQKIRSFFAPKMKSASEEPFLSEKCPHWTNTPSPLSALWTAPYLLITVKIIFLTRLRVCYSLLLIAQLQAIGAESRGAGGRGNSGKDLFYRKRLFLGQKSGPILAKTFFC